MPLSSTAFGTPARKGNPKGSTGKGTKKKDGLEYLDEDVCHAAALRPPEPLDLTEAELKEEITRVLTAKNPHAPDNIIRYSYKDKGFKSISVDHLGVHFVLDGNLLHQDSEEVGKLRANQAVDARVESEDEELETPATPVDEGEDDDRPDSAASKPDKKEQKLTNQFNFSERAAQTLIHAQRDRLNQTEPPPRRDFSDTANQWVIFDSYKAKQQNEEKNKEKKNLNKKETEKKKQNQTDSQVDSLNKISRVAQILERMVNQNIFTPILHDFKYFEDAADEGRQEGTLLPLWKFQFDRAKGLSVTALCWNKEHPDLFAVGMGSYEFSRQSCGLLLFYSLKNPSFPEFVFPLWSGVLCLDVHERRPHLAVVGLYDGGVAVFNLRRSKQQATHRSTAKSGKHTDPVWQVRWQNDDMDDNHNFYSVSSDGRVVGWTLVKNELVCTNIIRLTVNVSKEETVNACLTSFDVHKQLDFLFLVGTEKGTIYKCSKFYSDQFLDSYEAHVLAVDTVKWNQFHPKVFMSCSSDWTVKIWDHTISAAMFTFDFRCAVSDVSWAPYSSTVFSAVTTDGKVHVFDLVINKHQSLCQQQITAKKQLTHVTFNPQYPVLITGDDRGVVSCLKISPNLRKQPKVKKHQDQPKGPEAEVAKMERLLSLLRDSTASIV